MIKTLLLMILSLALLAIETTNFNSKFTLNYLLYQSNDGKQSYSYSNNGHLKLSSNYQVYQLIEGTPNTRYQITSCQENLFILQDNNFQTRFSFVKNRQLFTTKVNEKKVTHIGNGMMISTNTECSIASWYDYLSNEIIMYDIQDKNILFSLKAKESFKINSHFGVTPISRNSLLIYGYNKNDQFSLLIFDQNSKKYISLQKYYNLSSSPQVKICNNSLYIIRLEAEGEYVKVIKYNDINNIKDKPNELHWKKIKAIHSNFTCFKNQLFFKASIDINNVLFTSKSYLGHYNNEQLEVTNIPVQKISILGEQLLIESDGKLLKVKL